MYQESRPMAQIAINKSLVKEYSNRTVYLNDGDEFQIQLFNPHTEVIGADITINGTRMDGMIILKPGERVWLERWSSDAKKFKFSTYNVEDTNEVAAAIKNNGNITVKFYKERKLGINNRIKIQSNDWTFKPQTAYYYASPDSISSNLNLGGSILTSTSNLSASNLAFSESTVTDNIQINGYADNILSCSAQISTIETGRVEKGRNSDQTFNIVEGYDFNDFYFVKEDIKLLPASRKPVTSSDLQKIYCTECGRKISSKFKFCPFCGSKVK